VALECHDGSGSGCDKTYYSTDGSTPTTVYSSPITISATTTLKFFSKDKASNSEAVKTEVYTITPGGPDTVPPVTTPSPPEGFYTSAQSVTLTCTDAGGSGCDKVYYTVDGTTPTTSSPVYSSPINITVTTTLKFFAKDHAGNIEAVNTAVYVIGQMPCLNPTIKIGNTGYPTLQSAYNAAVNGDTIKCRELAFTENLIINRNITVTLDAGYDCGFTTNVGKKTTIYGVLATTAGSGSITVKNIVLDKNPGPPPPSDTTPPTTTAYPPGGTYNSPQLVTLECTDGKGSVCYDIHYTTDGSTPITVYSSPINISVTTTLKFFAKDRAGNSEAVKTQTYTITFTIGETNILSTDDNTGYGNWLVAQRATLGQTGTILSMSFYVKTPSGNLRLGIYDATGPNGGPGALKAQTAGFAPVSGWNTRNVVSQVSLQAGTYWLAFLPSSNYLVMKVATTGSAKKYNYAYGALPATFSTSPTSGTCHWSFYATLQ